MRFVAIDLLRLELDLRVPLLTSAGEHRHRPLVVLRVTTDEVIGYGECSALEEPTYTEEYADGAEAVLRAHLIPRVLAGADALTAVRALELMRPVRGHAMAKAGMEMALLDAELREQSISLATFLGVSRRSIPAGANVSLGRPDAVVAQVAGVVEAGYQRVKVKIAPGFDVEVLGAVRAAFPDIALSADANGAYELMNVEHRHALQRIDELGLTCIEQPLPAGDLEGAAALCRLAQTPVILDESLASIGDFVNAVALGALDGVSIKPARIGGLLASKELHDRASGLGLSLSIGGMLESGLGRAAAIALGALDGFNLPGDLGASDRYFDPDLTVPHVLVDGELTVPSGTGVGVSMHEDVLAATTVREAHFAR